MKKVLAILILTLFLPLSAGEFQRNRRFAAEMAEQGCWREARFRWEQIAEANPKDACALNNLAVAAEVMGDIEAALLYYQRAYLWGGDHPKIEKNFRTFLRAHQEIGEVYITPREKAPGHGKEVLVPVRARPRVCIKGMKTVLVASFRVTETSMLEDMNRELVRYMRRELQKHTGLEVLDVVPPPAIPEQILEVMIQNHEFWQHLGREYGADLILTGVVRFGRADTSHYQEVEVEDQYTGLKRKRIILIQEETFSFIATLLFFDGRTGKLLDMNTYTRGIAFRGEMNDPISAFYELCDPASVEMLMAIVPYWRVEPRFIFRRWK